jgi:hypothetical protein
MLFGHGIKMELLRCYQRSVVLSKEKSKGQAQRAATLEIDVPTIANGTFHFNFKPQTNRKSRKSARLFRATISKHYIQSLALAAELSRVSAVTASHPSDGALLLRNR